MLVEANGLSAALTRSHRVALATALNATTMTTHNVASQPGARGRRHVPGAGTPADPMVTKALAPFLAVGLIKVYYTVNTLREHQTISVRAPDARARRVSGTQTRASSDRQEAVSQLDRRDL